MTAPDRDVLEIARTLLAASTHVEHDLALIYCGRARLALEAARAEVDRLEIHIVARERDLARYLGPQEQLQIGGDDAER